MALHLPDNLKEEEIFWRYHFFLRQKKKKSVSVFVNRNKMQLYISYLWKVNFRRLYSLLLFQQILTIVENIHIVFSIIETKLLFIFRSWYRGSYRAAQHLSFCETVHRITPILLLLGFLILFIIITLKQQINIKYIENAVDFSAY